MNFNILSTDSLIKSFLIINPFLPLFKISNAPPRPFVMTGTLAWIASKITVGNGSGDIGVWIKKFGFDKIEY